MSGPVLVIDDSLTIRKLLEMVLGQAGYHVEFAVSGAEGLAAARRLRPSLVLLDYVLPDGKGSDVCAQLASDPATAETPIVVMSGKGEDIRPLFRPYAGVAGFLDKPFSPAGALDMVARHAGTGMIARAPTVPPAPAEPPSVAAPMPAEGDRREQLAQTLYRVLADRLARIPGWCTELGTQAPAPFFARRLLTPEAMGAALVALPEVIVATAPSTPSDGGSGAIAGSTRIGGVRALLRFLVEAGAGGELTLGKGGETLVVYLQQGQPVLVVPTSAEPVRRVLGAGGHLPGVDPTLPAALAAISALPDAEGAEILHRVGVAALVRAMGSGPLPYALVSAAAPAWLPRWARAIEPEQVALARLREVDDWAQIELRVASLDQVCERSPGFADLLPRLALVEAERRVLHLVDGRAPVARIVERSGLSTFDVFHILFRLIQVGLVRARSAAAETTAVLACGGGLGATLAALLTTRRPGTVVREVGAESLLGGLARERPRVTLIDVDDVDAPALAKEVRARLDISDAVLVAVVGRWDPAQVRALGGAGFDGVLARPVHIAAIERLLGN